MAKIDTKLDANQVLRQAYDETNQRLRVDAKVSASISDLFIEDPEGHILNVNPDGSLNAVVAIAAADGDNIAIKSSTGNELGISAAGAASVDVKNFPANTSLTDAQLRATPVPVSGTVAVSNFPASQAVTGAFFQATQPVSTTSLPLPTGAATSALQTQPGVDIGDVTINNAAGAGAVNIQDGGNSITVDGTIGINNFPSNQAISATSLPLPTGASTSALQTSGNTSLSNIDTKTPALGQATMLASTPVVIASNQTAIPVSGTVSANATLSAETTKVIGTINISAEQTIGTVSSVTAIVNALPAGTNSIGQVTTNAGTNTSTVALNLETTQAAMSAKLPATLGTKSAATSFAVTMASDQPEISVRGIDTTSSGSIAAAAQTVALELNNKSGVALQLTGTWVGTIQFEGTVDGTNWVPINGVFAGTSTPGPTTTTNGVIRLTPSGLAQVRVIATAWTSGTATVSLRASNATGGTFLNQSLTAGTNNIGGVFETPITPKLVTGTLTAVGQTVTFGSTLGMRNITVVLSGTWGDALNDFEGLNLNGVWENIFGTSLGNNASTGLTRGSAVGIATSVGTYVLNITGYSNFRVRCRFYTSGTINVHIEGTNLQTSTYVTQAGRFEVAPRDTTNNTFSAAITGLVATTSPTDIFTISGTLTNNVIKITKIVISATQTTATNRDIQIIRRSTLNTGGISTVLTNVVHGGFATANATVRTYTANPILGTLTGLMRSQKLFIPTTTTQGRTLVFDFGEGIARAPFISNTTDSICVNLNGVSSAGSSFDIWIEWTEKFNES